MDNAEKKREGKTLSVHGVVGDADVSTIAGVPYFEVIGGGQK